jgi:HAE1 family hydrophobic/amphiphilic exporter-1
VLSGKQPLVRLQQLAEDVVQPQFNALPGVGSASIRSGIVREVHVLVDEEKLRGRGLSINQVVGALQSQQLEVPAGSISQGTRDFSVYFDSLAPGAEALGAIVVAQTATGPVYLRDVARIEDAIRKRSAIVRVDGEEGIALVVAKLPAANTIAVVDEVKAAIARLSPQLPPSVRLDVVVDTSVYTAKSFNAVRTALLEAVVITGLILLLFLHTWRSTVIVLVSIPVSILVTLVLMNALDFNLNLLTMVALTVSVGILVDDSIVVLENINRHLDRGKPPLQAALDGRGEIGLAAITITLVDVVVYLPLAVLTTGIPRQFIGPFAVVITVATLASLAVSFTLTPLLAARALHGGHQGAGAGPSARLGRVWDGGFAGLEHGYAWLLRRALPRRWLVIAIGLATFVGGLSLPFLGFVGFDFFPAGDQSEVDVNLTMPPATSLAATDAVARQIEADLRARSEVRSVYTVVGAAQGSGRGAAANDANQAQIAGLLVGPRERAKSSAALAEGLRRDWEARFPGAKIRIGLPNAFGFGGFGDAPILVRVLGPDPAALESLAQQVEDAVRTVPGAVEIENSNDNRQPQLRATIDWTRAADLGVAPRDAGQALRASLDGFASNQIQLRQSGRSAIPIRVLSEAAGRLTPEELSRLTVGGARGPVELGQFTTLRQAQVPTRIQRIDRTRSITVGVNAGQGALVGDVQRAIERRVGTIPLPTGYRVAYDGQSQQGGQAVGDMVRAMGVGVLLMYMLMMMLFGSLTLPLAVLMSLPLAVVGALGGLALTHNPFTLFSLLGMAVLLGLVGKNAILLVDLTDRLRAQGDDRFTALVKAGPTRLRPIVMTTISVQAALLPIASGLEEGSELLQSVAVVLIGGLLTSTLLTLVFVPAMYTVFDDVERGLRWLLGWRTTPLAPSSNGRAQLDGVEAASERPEPRPLPAAPRAGNTCVEAGELGWEADLGEVADAEAQGELLGVVAAE